MPQALLGIAKSRVTPPPIGGPPNGPFALRVSAIRHGVMETNRSAEATVAPPLRTRTLLPTAAAAARLIAWVETACVVIPLFPMVMARSVFPSPSKSPAASEVVDDPAAYITGAPNDPLLLPNSTLAPPEPLATATSKLASPLKSPVTSAAGLPPV